MTNLAEKIGLESSNDTVEAFETVGNEYLSPISLLESLLICQWSANTYEALQNEGDSSMVPNYHAPRSMCANEPGNEELKLS